MTYVLDIEIADVPTLENRISKRHWSPEHRHRKKWRELVCYATVGKRPVTPLPKADVQIDVWRKGKRPDPDNLDRSMKPVLDGLQPRKQFRRGKKWVVHIGAGIIEDDQEKNFVGGAARVVWHWVAKGGRERIRIVVREPVAPWVECPLGCGDFLCTIHGKHVHDCSCPHRDEWSGNPYSRLTEGP